jgi:uncharacterized protein
MLVAIMLISLVLPNFYSNTVIAATLAKDLFISEYIEGGGFNKAVEIFNGTGAPVKLSEYTLEHYNNGAKTTNLTLALSDDSAATLENGKTFVISRDDASADIVAKANLLDASKTVVNWNGDDAVVLKHNGTIIDVIGQVGVDPGASWGTTVKTADQTLVRKSFVIAGDNNLDDAFDPAVEWDNMGKDVATYLGTHTMDGGSTPVETKVANVTASPAAGAVTTGTKVILETATADAKIYYTTDGTEPTAGSTPYTAPIEITQDTTIKAIAVKADLENSDVSEFVYSILQKSTIAEVRAMALQSNVQTSGVVTAVLGRAIYFQDATAAIVAYTPTDSTTIFPGDQITVTGQLTEYSSLLEINVEHKDIIKTGTIEVPAAELVKAADFKEEIEAKLVKLRNVTINSFSSGNYTATDADGNSFQIRPGSSAWLTTGTTYEEITGVLSAYGNNFQLIPRTTEDIILDSSIVKTVVATPGAGLVKAGTSVTLATGTDGATIHYTTDGSVPTTSSPVYSEPIVINQETTVKAIAVKEGMKTSSVATFDYLIQDGAVHIYNIQGKQHTSKYNGLNVTDVEGIVTYVDGTSRFFMQDLTGDNDNNTSDGIQVFKSSHGVKVGDLVKVTGTVTEFVGEGYAEKADTDLATTQISASTITPNGTAQLPAPIKLGEDRVAPKEIIDNDKFTVFDPEEDAIDFWESIEGMYVQVDNPKVIALQKDALVWVVPNDYQTNVEPGGLRITATDTNPDRIALDIRNGSTANKDYDAKMGDNFTAPVSGVVHYGYSNYKVMVQETSLPALNRTPIDRAATKLVPADDKLTIATYNVENFSTKTPDEKVTKIGDAIVRLMKSPDIIGLNEVQDNNGETNDGTVDGTQSAQKIIDKIKELGGPTYAYTEVAPLNNTDGGAPGGNIRVAFLYKTDRVSLTTGAPKGTATQSVGYENGKLTLNPGRIDPTNEAFNSSRKPLAAQFEFQGQSIIVVANHFNSKGGDQPLFGKNQPPVLSSEVQRHKIAAIVNNFVKDIKAKNPNANVVALGDFNDFEFTETVRIAKGNEMTNMIDFVPENQRYNYSYQGNAQVLDQVLVTNNMVPNTVVDIMHINSGFMEIHGRASDHDPVIIQTQLQKEILPPVTPPANTKIYKLNNFKTKKLTVTSGAADITVSADSVLTEGIVLKGSYAKLQGEGLKNTTIIISPTEPGAIIDLSGVEVKEVIIDNANISQIRGAENVQKWTVRDGVDTSNIKFANVGGEVFTSPFFPQPETPTPETPQPGTDLEPYYQAAAGKIGADLKLSLHNIIKVQTKKLTYSEVTEALKKTDEDPNNPNNVILLYTGRSQAKTTFGPGVDDWNREHVWAKSHGDFGTSIGPGTDIHHLRPTDASVNSTRGHLDFDEGGNSQGECADCYYDSDSFEPPNRVKGDVARMLMYMAVRYEGDGGELDLELADKVNTYPTPFHGKLSVLLKWSKMDPPDAFEKHRNDVIQSIQGNRNPFIDHPEWAETIWPAS